jgi:hypothetical protein
METNVDAFLEAYYVKSCFDAAQHRIEAEAAGELKRTENSFLTHAV